MNFYIDVHSSHLPLLFIGMEQIILSNPQQADESLNAAHAMCEGDPLLANERGVMAFNHGRFVIPPFQPKSTQSS